MKRKRLIKTIVCFFIAVIIIRIISDDIIPSNNPNYLIDTNLLLDALQQAKIRESDVEYKYQIAAIIIHFNHLSRVQKLVEIYLNSKLFKEIIVWNNNPQIILNYSQVVMNNNSSTSIYITNSEENLKDQAKYRACINAQTLACFYVADHFDPSHYMKSLIASFRSDPNVLHAATNDITYYNNMLWTFTDPQINLHTGFSWLDSGSVFLHEHAMRHLQLLMTHVKDHQGIYFLIEIILFFLFYILELLAYSDIFFSIWLNDIPSQMIVDLRSLPTNKNETDQPFPSQGSSTDFHHTSAVLAIRKLEFTLRLNQSTTDINFPRQQNRRFSYFVRSPSPDDDFIFYSNILPVDIEHIPFDIARDADRATYRNVPIGPNYIHFASHHTFKAVDNDEKTCWHPLDTVKKGDFFAIDFFRIQHDIAFALVIGHSSKLQSSLDIRISFDGTWWISHQSFTGTFMDVDSSSTTNLYKLVVDSRQFPLELQAFRYIAFNATDAFSEAYQICDIKLIKHFKMNAT